MTDPTTETIADTIASAITGKPKAAADNPLLAESGLPRFDVIRPEHIVPGMATILERANQQLDTLESSLVQIEQPGWDDVFPPIANLGRLFERSWSAVGHLFGVMNSDPLREAYETVQPDYVAFGLRLGQSKPIYEAMKKLQTGQHFDALSDMQKRVLEKNILGAELSGIGLEGEELERFNAISQELSKHSTEYSNNVLDATNAYKLTINNPADVEGLPSSLRTLAAATYNARKPDDLPEATPADGPWTITLEASSFSPFMAHCRNRTYREQVYKAFLTRASAGELDNTAHCNAFLKLRQEKAELLGYDNYAKLSLAQKMADGPEAVMELLERLRAASWDAAIRDLEEIQQLAKQGTGDVPPLKGELTFWDVAFWAERLKEQKYDFREEDLRPYFSHELVLDGFFDLVSHLFGIEITKTEGTAPVWHEDVRYYEIRNVGESEPIAGFYLDPYSRPATKRPGAWMNDCLGLSCDGEQKQLPVAHLVCNATPPAGGKPSLMSFREVETLFHEFGHGLQHMLTVIDEPEASGITGVEWDAVELPSQFMENWCYHKPTMDKLARHYETGEPLPDELFDKLVAAKTYRAGSLMLRQLSFGMTDMKLHTEYEPGGDRTIFDVQREVMEKTSPLGMFEGDRFLCSFQHIFAGGYSAGYYSYKWAEVLSADAFSAFEDAGLDNPEAVAETGRRFRDTVLALGGSQHPMEIFKAFRGREPSPEPLLRHNGLAS